MEIQANLLPQSSAYFEFRFKVKTFLDYPGWFISGVLPSHTPAAALSSAALGTQTPCEFPIPHCLLLLYYSTLSLMTLLFLNIYFFYDCLYPFFFLHLYTLLNTVEPIDSFFFLLDLFCYVLLVFLLTKRTFKLLSNNLYQLQQLALPASQVRVGQA